MYTHIISISDTLGLLHASITYNLIIPTFQQYIQGTESWQVGAHTELRAVAESKLLEATRQQALAGALGALVVAPSLAQPVLAAYSDVLEAAQALDPHLVTSSSYLRLSSSLFSTRWLNNRAYSYLPGSLLWCSAMCGCHPHRLDRAMSGRFTCLTPLLTSSMPQTIVCNLVFKHVPD